jgi:uncharacterized protein (DUF58 family)
MRLKTLYDRARRRYLEGPDWVELPPFMNYKYRSRTMLALFWVYGYYVRWFTVHGRMLITVLLISLMYNLFSIDNPVRLLTFSMLAIFLMDFILGYIFKPRIRISRRLPERVRAGSATRLSYHVENKRKMPAWNVAIDSNLGRQGLKYVKEEASVDCLPGKKSSDMHSYIYAERRGRYELPAPIIDSAFPFCILKWSCRGNDSQQLIVYPSYSNLLSLDLPMGKKYQRNGPKMISKVGESMDFLGCREFRTGDDPRHIHWPSSARAGDLVVREFQEDRLSRIALIVDTFIPHEKKLRNFIGIKSVYPEFEATISLTAALADFLSNGDFIIDIFAAGPEVYYFQGGRSLAHFDNILDILACLEPNRKEPIKRLSPTVMEEVSGIGSAVLILMGWDDERESLVKELENSGVAVKIVIVTGKKDFKIERPAEILDPGDIFKGKVRKL